MTEVFIDSSNVFTVTPTGNLAQSAFSPFTGFAGSTQFNMLYASYDSQRQLFTSITNVFNLSADFTIECWVHPYFLSPECAIFFGNTTSSAESAYEYKFYLKNIGDAYKLTLNVGGTDYSDATPISLRTWTHVAIARVQSTARFFINGTLSSTTTLLGSVGETTIRGMIGPQVVQNWGYYPDGKYLYLSNLRVSNQAKYTTNFTPAKSLSVDQSTLLLCLQDNMTKDYSSYNHTITAGLESGGSLVNPSIVSPENNYSSYDLQDEYSTYFNGAPTFVDLPASSKFALGTDAYTIEFWIRMTGTTANYTFKNAWIFKLDNAGWNTPNNLALYFNNFNTLILAASGTAILSIPNGQNLLPLNTWTHVAICRYTNSGVALFINGISVAGGSSGDNHIPNSGSPRPRIGNEGGWSNTGNIKAHMYAFKITKGRAVYESDFMPKITKQVAEADTSVLLFQNSVDPSIDESGNSLNAIDAASVSIISNRNPSISNKLYDASGYWCAKFSASSLSAQVSTQTNLTGNFTIEFWVNFVVLPTTNFSYLFDCGGKSLRWNANNFSWEFYFGTDVITYYNIPTTQTWYHVAITRSGSTFRMFVNGSQVGTMSSSATTSNGKFVLGCRTDGHPTTYLNAFMSNFRVVKGTALYTQAFTPSKTPLVPIEGTSLLLLNANRHVDYSSNRHFLSTSNCQLVSTSPFSLTSPYNKTYNAGSVYFNGSSWLELSPGSSFDFSSLYTIDFFVYPLGSGYLLSTIPGPVSGTYRTSVDLKINSDKTLTLRYIFRDGTIYTTTTTAKINFNEWNHVAITKPSDLSNEFDTFLSLNGFTVGRINTGSQHTFGRVFIGCGVSLSGAGSPGVEPFTGYISSFKKTNNGAYYYEDFTPPSNALDVISAPDNCALYFTNPKLLDYSSAKSTFVPVGEVQFSSEVKKFGSKSIYFNGIDGQVVIPNSESLDFGMGAFTIEMWVYKTNTLNCDLFTKQSSGGVGPWAITIEGLVIKFKYSNSESEESAEWASPTLSGSLSGYNEWNHIAVTRISSTFRLFVNGVIVGTTTINNGSLFLYSNDKDVSVGGNTGTGWYQGYLDDLRVTKGVARYVSNFVPPMETFPIKGEVL